MKKNISHISVTNLFHFRFFMRLQQNKSLEGVNTLHLKNGRRTRGSDDLSWAQLTRPRRPHSLCFLRFSDIYSTIPGKQIRGRARITQQNHRVKGNQRDRQPFTETVERFYVGTRLQGYKGNWIWYPFMFQASVLVDDVLLLKLSVTTTVIHISNSIAIMRFAEFSWRMSLNE